MTWENGLRYIIKLFDIGNIIAGNISDPLRAV